MPRATPEIVTDLRSNARYHKNEGRTVTAVLLGEAADRLENAARPITPAMARDVLGADAHDDFVRGLSETWSTHALVCGTGAIDEIVAAGARSTG